MRSHFILQTDSKLIFVVMKTAVALKGGKITMQATYCLCLKMESVLFCLRIACIACIQASKNDTYFVTVKCMFTCIFAAICHKRC